VESSRSGGAIARDSASNIVFVAAGNVQLAGDALHTEVCSLRRMEFVHFHGLPNKLSNLHRSIKLVWASSFLISSFIWPSIS
jgi:hypothetical protein